MTRASYRKDDIEIVPASEDHIDFFVKVCREEDRNEALAGTGVPLRYALMEGIRHSLPTCWTTLARGEPHVIAGVGPHGDKPGVGLVWMVGSNVIESHPKLFHFHSLQLLKKMHNNYPTLSNVADTRNIVHIFWLRRLGFKFTKLHPEWGPLGLPFWEFERTENRCAPQS